jgi:hypothetical protein
MAFFFIPPQVRGDDLAGSREQDYRKWDMKMNLQWHIDAAGDNVFTVIDGISTLEDNSFIVLDRKNYKLFRFDSKGKFLSSYGTRGEGPGEFAKLRKMLLKNNTLIVVDNRNIHYFTSDMDYQKSIPNNYNKYPPASFVGLSKFISVTIFAGDTRFERKGKISLYDLESKTNTVISRFKLFRKGSIRVGKPGNYRTYSFSVSCLTPQMVLHHRGDRLYMAMSDDFQVKVTDLTGKEHFSFSHKRERIKVSEEFKKSRVQRFDFPPEVKKMALKNMPDYLNIIEEIYVDDNGFIYITEPVYRYPNRQRVDIFSATGQYLYETEIKVDPQYQIEGVQIKKGFLYVVLQDENGDLALERYTVTLPGKS